MKIVQMVPTFSGKDAIGNDVINIYKALEVLGYKTVIYTNRATNAVAFPCTTQFRADDFASDDVVMYHFSIGDKMTDFFASLQCRKILVYHNVTPPGFFHSFDPVIERRCRAGLQQIRTLVGKVDYCLADSEWNKKDLERMGFYCPIDVFPILMDFNEYRNTLDESLFKMLSLQPGTKILSVGRIVPNKCQHDILRVFSCYKSNFDPEAKLFLVGGYDERDVYYSSLVSYAVALGLSDVYFTGSLPFDQLTACYRASDVFLCQSEHEGFCVPLLESMVLDLPVVAYGACAVAETMGSASFVLDSKDPMVTAGVIDRLMRDPGLRSAVLSMQQRRAEDFGFGVLVERLNNLLDKFMEQSE